MSRRVVRYDANGRKVWSANEPSVARRQGFGGVAAGYWTGTVTVHEQRRRKTLPRQPLAGTRQAARKAVAG